MAVCTQQIAFVELTFNLLKLTYGFTKREIFLLRITMMEIEYASMSNNSTILTFTTKVLNSFPFYTSYAFCLILCSTYFTMRVATIPFRIVSHTTQFVKFITWFFDTAPSTFFS